MTPPHVKTQPFDLEPFSGAIAMRELRLAFGRRWALARLLLFAAAAGAAVYVVWPREVKLLIHRDRVSQWTLDILAGSLRALVLLVGPAYAALSITRDREQGSLDMLCVTPGGARHIFYGKSLASVAFLWMLIAATMPAAAAVYALGGVAAWRLCVVYLELFLWSAAIGIVGVTCSARVEQSPGALALAYGYILPAGALWMIFPDYHPLWILAPALVVPSILRHPATLRFLAYPADIVHSESAKFFSYAATEGKEWSALLLLPPRLRRPIWDFVNPVLTREILCERLGGAIWLHRLLPSTLLVGLGGAIWLIGQEAQPALWHLLAVGIVMLVAPALGAPSISREFDHGVFDSMVVTPLRPFSILWPKVYVSFRAAMTVYALSCLLVIPFTAWQTPWALWQTPWCLAIVAAAALFLAVGSVFCSLAGRSTTQALACAYGLAAALFAGGPLACHVFRVFSDVPVDSYGWIATLSPAAPLFALGQSKFLSDIATEFGPLGLAKIFCAAMVALSAILFTAMTLGFDWFWKKGPLRRM